MVPLSEQDTLRINLRLILCIEGSTLNFCSQELRLRVICVLNFLNLVCFSEIWDIRKRSSRQNKSDSLRIHISVNLSFHKYMLSLSRQIPSVYFSGLCSFYCCFIKVMITLCEVRLAQPRGDAVCSFPVWPVMPRQHQPVLGCRRRWSKFREPGAAQVTGEFTAG